LTDLTCSQCNRRKHGEIQGRAFLMVARGLYVLLAHGESLDWLDQEIAILEEKPPNAYAKPVPFL